MLENQTAAATEEINNFSDAQMGGSGIGQSSANINLDAEKPKQMTAKPLEDKETQGQHEQNLDNWNTQLDKYQNFKDMINHEDLNPNTVFHKNALLNLLKKQLGEKTALDIMGTGNNGNEMHINDIKNKINDYLDKEMIGLRDKVHGEKSKETYDNRTDEQKRADEKDKTKEEREDNAYQRAVQDMLKAGLNPAGISGGAMASGGGGGGSSKSDDEEEKRRKRKKELEAMKAAELQREQEKKRQQMQMLGMIAGALGMFGLQGMRNQNALEVANTERKYRRR